MKNYFIYLFIVSFLLCAQVKANDLNLNGLVFYGKKNKVDLEGYKDLCGIKLECIDVPDQKCFCEKMKTFLGKPISAQMIREIKTKVIDYYKFHKYPLIVVMTPEGQDVTSGVLRVLILKGKLGNLKACGARYYSNEKIACEIRTCPGEEIDFYKMMDDLTWINRNPYLDTDIVYSPAEEIGFTDVTLQTCDRFPVKVYAGYENTGNIIGGNSRYLVGVNAGNFFSLDHQLRYLFITASDFNRWYAHTGNYMLPFRWRHILEVNGAYSESRPDLDVTMDMKGYGWRVGSRYIMPFNFCSIESELFFGYQFKRTNNFLTFAQTLVFDKDFDISQFVLGYVAKKSYYCGQTAAGITLYISPGDMTKYNTTEIFEQERPGAQSDYIYGEFYFDQYLQFWKGFSWVFNFKAQLSSEKLLPLEAFSLGGYYTVRGYDENEVIGDNGFLIKNEIRSRPWCWFKRMKGQLQGLIFVDFGLVADADKNIISSNSTVLASIGPGLRYQLCENLLARADYGWQLHDINRLIDESNKSGRFHVAVTLSF